MSFLSGMGGFTGSQRAVKEVKPSHDNKKAMCCSGCHEALGDFISVSHID